jgi:hypothetical protein
MTRSDQCGQRPQPFLEVILSRSRNRPFCCRPLAAYVDERQLREERDRWKRYFVILTVSSLEPPLRGTEVRLKRTQKACPLLRDGNAEFAARAVTPDGLSSVPSKRCTLKRVYHERSA